MNKNILLRASKTFEYFFSLVALILTFPLGGWGRCLFTREYTQCTAGYTFCFVVVGVGATFSQTWHYFSRQLIKHD
jgi:hypothetical protein